MDMDEAQGKVSEDTTPIFDDDKQTQIQKINKTEDKTVKHIGETHMVNGTNVNETVKTNVDNALKEPEHNNIVQSEGIEPVMEEETSNGALKSISENEIENKLEVDTKESITNQKSFEKDKETYKEEKEENGEDQDITKLSLLTVKKQASNDGISEEEIEEEYEEEEYDENGEVKVVKKIRMVKGLKTSDRKSHSVLSYVEKEEQYEVEEVNEAGESNIVMKTRLVRIPKESAQKIDDTFSFEEVEEEFEIEEVNSKGEVVTLIKKRIVQVPNKIIMSELHDLTDEGGESIGEEKSIEKELISKAEDIEEPAGENDLLHADEKGSDGEKIETDKNISYKLEQGEIIGSEEVDESKGSIEKKKRERSKSYIGIEESKSQLRVKEGEEDGQEGSVVSTETVSKLSSKVTISSEEQRIAAEKAEIAQQFDILLKLRGDHIFLRRKNFSLNNKLVQYFKKQKMEYVFTETKDEHDLDNKFYKKLEKFFDHNKEIMEEKIKINTEWESQKQLNEELSNTVKEASENLFDKKREIGSKMIDSHTGRPIHHDKAIDDVVGRQEQWMIHLSDCCLSQIKLKRRIEGKRRERQMQHMGNEFNLMDYEKLSSLKEYYMDKITERDVEINEVSEKLAAMEENTNLVRDRLTHTEDELEIEQLRLQDISSNLLRKRANLNEVKANRHKTEKNTAKIKQQSGLLAYPILLKDYEDKSQQLKELTSHLELLKQTHKNGSIKIRKLRDSIKKRTAIKYSTGFTGKVSAISTSPRES